MSEQALVVSEAGAVAQPSPTPADMLKAVINAGITEQNVVAVEKLVGLYERMEAKNAERTFSAALVKLQADVRHVQAVRPVTVGGTVRYMFAPYEDLMKEVEPHLEANGFSISYSSKIEGDRITKTLHLRHVCGHVESNDYSTKISRPIANRDGHAVVSEAQMESMASTTAKRGALCDALNIVVEKYEQADARDEGSPVTAEQAADLERRVAATKGDRELFLRLAGAKTFKEIMSNRYADLDAALAKRERIQKTKTDDIQKRINEGRP